MPPGTPDLAYLSMSSPLSSVWTAPYLHTLAGKWSRPPHAGGLACKCTAFVAQWQMLGAMGVSHTAVQRDMAEVSGSSVTRENRHIDPGLFHLSLFLWLFYFMLVPVGVRLEKQWSQFLIWRRRKFHSGRNISSSHSICICVFVYVILQRQSIANNLTTSHAS